MQYRTLLLTWFLLLQLVPAYSQDFVVINSSEAAYKPGQTFTVGDPIRLTAGAKVTLIAAAGNVVRLQGPHSGALSLPGTNDPGSSDALAPLSALVARAAGKSASLGATREAEETGRGSTSGQKTALWDIDALRPGSQCVRAGPLTLVRGNAVEDLQVTVWPLSGSKRIINWPAGKSTVILDETSDMISGTQLGIAGPNASVAIILWRLPDEIDTTARGKVLLWLSGRRCETQALQLAAEIARPIVAPK